MTRRPVFRNLIAATSFLAFLSAAVLAFTFVFPFQRTDWPRVYAAFSEIWSVRINNGELTTFTASLDVNKLDSGATLHKAIPLMRFCLLIRGDTRPMSPSDLDKLKVTSPLPQEQAPLKAETRAQMISTPHGSSPMYVIPVSKDGLLTFTVESISPLAPETTIHLSIRRCQVTDVKDLAIGEKLEKQAREIVLPIVITLCVAGTGLLMAFLWLRHR
jgi:hypothetical protein